jgi:mono/diheme cytochrome c family protein
MRTNRIKFIAIILFVLPLITIAALKVTPTSVAAKTADDPAVTYKAKCAACHTAAVTKFFDPTKADAELTETVLKGKKGDKPPFMPGFEAKGMTADEAKSMVTYMKSQRATAN